MVVDDFVTGGYASGKYAKSFEALGTPRRLPRSGGWIVVRAIPGTPYQDAMGCYPLFCCPNWRGLEADLSELGTETDITSLALVTDPFGDYDEDYLRRCFPDRMLRFKEHFVVDLSRPADGYVSRHHRRNVDKALDTLDVRVCNRPDAVLDKWVALYRLLVERHHIMGIPAFSAEAFAAQFRVPGLTVFEAVHEDETVGMLLWYVHDAVAYYHLGAYNDAGYRHNASFGLFWTAIEHFSSTGLGWLDLGAGAGAQQTTGGLTRFKQGWATGSRPAFFCGRVIASHVYDLLATAGPSGAPQYFPPYRNGEFV